MGSGEFRNCPDITTYVEALDRFIVSRMLDNVIVHSPFVLRAFHPEISACSGKVVKSVSQLGKRIVWKLSDEL